MDEFTNERVKDWWPCACVKGGNWRKGKASTHIKLNAPTRKRCSTCGITKAQHDQAAAALPRSPAPTGKGDE